jgi:hypothetical protein
MGNTVPLWVALLPIAVVIVLLGLTRTRRRP